MGLRLGGQPSTYYSTQKKQEQLEGTLTSIQEGTTPVGKVVDGVTNSSGEIMATVEGSVNTMKIKPLKGLSLDDLIGDTPEHIGFFEGGFDYTGGPNDSQAICLVEVSGSVPWIYQRWIAIPDNQEWIRYYQPQKKVWSEWKQDAAVDAINIETSEINIDDLYKKENMGLTYSGARTKDSIGVYPSAIKVGNGFSISIIDMTGWVVQQMTFTDGDRCFICIRHVTNTGLKSEWQQVATVEDLSKTPMRQILTAKKNTYTDDQCYTYMTRDTGVSWGYTEVNETFNTNLKVGDWITLKVISNTGKTYIGLQQVCLIGRDTAGAINSIELMPRSYYIDNHINNQFLSDFFGVQGGQSVSVSSFFSTLWNKGFRTGDTIPFAWAAGKTINIVGDNLTVSSVDGGGIHLLNLASEPTAVWQQSSALYTTYDGRSYLIYMRVSTMDTKTYARLLVNDDNVPNFSYSNGTLTITD